MMSIELTADKTKQNKMQKVKTIPLLASKLDLWISVVFVFGKPVLANSLQGIFALIYCLFGK